MINKIYAIEFDSYIIECEKIINKNVFTLENHLELHSKDISRIKIVCNICNKLSKELKLNNLYLKNKYNCRICSMSGSLNPFYGKTHSKETKDKIGKANSGGKSRKGGIGNYDLWVKKYGLEEANRRNSIYLNKLSNCSSGCNNPMYGKRIPQESIERTKIKLKEYRDNLTDEQKLNLSKKLSDIQKQLQDKDPQLYKEWKRSGGIAASKSQKRYQMNKIEKIVEQELIKRNLNDFKYSTILNHKQFDFGNKQYRILLEVQGDYWHGNPNIYNKLNSIQKSNCERDKIKIQFALDYNFKLFHIWEQDILQNNFNILDQIKDYINEI